MLIDSDLDSEAIPSPRGNLLRPLSPSVSLSYVEHSNYSFGGLYELDKMIAELQDMDSNPSPQKNPNPHSAYTQKVLELKSQIQAIQDLYSKEVIEHEAERKSFEQALKSLKPDPFEQRFQVQIKTLSSISDTLSSLQHKLKSL